MASEAGRVNDHPICRRCRFDLVGLPSLKTCPECGKDLALPNSIRIGLRRRHRAPIIIGLALFTLLTAGPATVLYTQSRGYNWNTVLPAWALELKAHSSDQFLADSALAELARRLTVGQLPEARTSRLVRDGIAYQSDPTLPWIPGWGDLIEAARTAGLVTEEQWESYGRHAFSIRVFVTRTDILLAELIMLSPGQSSGLLGTESGLLGLDIAPLRIGHSPIAPKFWAEILELTADTGSVKLVTDHAFASASASPKQPP